MAALVVVDVSRSSRTAEESLARLDIFPGRATPSVFPAGTPFWIGYGFAPDTGAHERTASVDEGTRFELDVDGRPVELGAEVSREAGVVARKVEYADFAIGLSAGWHTFSGRWFDGGRLLLSHRATIEFVER